MTIIEYCTFAFLLPRVTIMDEDVGQPKIRYNSHSTLHQHQSLVEHLLLSLRNISSLDLERKIQRKVSE